MDMLDKIYDLIFKLACKYDLSPIEHCEQDEVFRSVPGLRLWEAPESHLLAGVNGKSMIVLCNDPGSWFEFIKVRISPNSSGTIIRHHRTGTPCTETSSRSVLAAMPFLRELLQLHKEQPLFCTELREELEKIGVGSISAHSIVTNKIITNEQMNGSVDMTGGIMQNQPFEPKAPVLEITPPGNYEEFMSLVTETLFTQDYFSPCEFSENWIKSSGGININHIARTVQPGVYHSEDVGGKKYLIIVLRTGATLVLYRHEQDPDLPGGGMYIWSATSDLEEVFEAMNGYLRTLTHNGYVFIKHLVDTRVLWSGSI